MSRYEFKLLVPDPLPVIPDDIDDRRLLILLAERYS
jgi:hypothetical protein